MKTCNQCSIKLLNPRSQFCSLACAGIAKRKVKIIKKCLYCGSDIECLPHDKKKFCNRSCSASFNNIGNTRHGIPAISCKGCGSKTNARNKTGYCSTQCRQKDEVKKYLAGELDGSGKYTLAVYAKRYVIERAGNKCEHCGYCKKRPDGSSILQIDHKDGNWQNNRPENLQLLCPNCHCLTPNWGAANMGNGRSWKRKYNQFGEQTGHFQSGDFIK